MGRSVAPLLLLALLVVGGPAVAQELWQGTKYGMTVAEVRAIIPNAVPAGEKPNRFASGEVEQLRIDDLTIVGTSHEVEFFFKDGGLRIVALNPNKKMDRRQADALYEELLPPLRAKYGMGVEAIERDPLYIRKSTWQLGRTSVQLRIISVAPSDGGLSVTYSTKVAAESEKL